MGSDFYTAPEIVEELRNATKVQIFIPLDVFYMISLVLGREYLVRLLLIPTQEWLILLKFAQGKIQLKDSVT
jgi:hypothetical protein